MLPEWLVEPLNSLMIFSMGFVYIYVLAADWRLPKKIMKKITVLFILCVFALDLLIYWRLGTGRVGKNVTELLDFTIILSFILAFTHFHQGRILFVCFSTMNFLLAGCIMGEVIASASIPGRMMIRIAVSVVIFLLIYHYFRHPMLDMLGQIEGGWKRMSLIPLFFSVLFNILITSGDLYLDSEMKLIAVVAVLTGGSTYIVLYRVFCDEKKKYQIQANYSLLESQMKSLQNQLETMQNVNHTYDIFRHDMRHFLQIQKICLDQGDIDGAKQILSSVGQDLEESRLQIHGYTDCPMIDAVLSTYGKKAGEQGTAYTVKLSMPRKLAEDPVELAVVIANSLENAYNACGRMADGSERAIRLQGKVEKEQFFLEIANTYEGEVQFDQGGALPVTDRKGHGYGTQSVLAFAERHHAYVKYSASDRWFRLRLIIPLDENEGYKITV